MTSFFTALGDYRRAHRFIIQERMWVYLLVPGLLSIMYLVLLLALGAGYFDNIARFVVQHWLPGFLQGTVLYVITAILVWLLWLILIYMTYKHVVLIIFSTASNFLTILAAVSSSTSEI
jgi:hypothetical protein